jgi:hypothetical protein
VLLLRLHRLNITATIVIAGIAITIVIATRITSDDGCQRFCGEARMLPGFFVF